MVTKSTQSLDNHGFNRFKNKKLAAKDKPYSIADGEGLIIEVLPSGSKVWRYRYRMNGTNGSQEKITLGSYPEISLAEARMKKSEFRRMILDGISPAKAKQVRKNPLF